MTKHSNDTSTTETLASSKLMRRALHLLKKTPISQKSIRSLLDLSDLSPEQPHLYRNNIEKFAGTLKIPIGIAGPMLVRGTFAQGLYHIPLATTEGGLVASYDRGCKIIRRSGGAVTTLVDEGVSRVPAFVFDSLIQARDFVAWSESQFETFKRIAESTTRYGKLKKIKPYHEGNRVFLAFCYTTGNASGQNMVTIATEAILRYIMDACPISIENAYLEINFSSDKKASYYSLLNVRGKKICTEVCIPARVCEQLLHINVEGIVQVWDMCRHAATLIGAVGHGAHYANGLAALYLATGQDAACVAESVTGITRMEKTQNNDLYISVTLPNIMVGTVGGGTELPSQQAGMEILGIGRGPNSAHALAEIMAALCMAGEISLIAAIAAGQFALAHQHHARR